MKITRFARGYRLRLTDGEMAALDLLVGLLANRLDNASMNTVLRGRGRRIVQPFRKMMAGRGLRVDADLRPALKRQRRREPTVGIDGYLDRSDTEISNV